MNIINKNPLLEAALNGIEAGFRTRIIAVYLELKHRNAKALYNGEHDASGISAGKFCEIMFRFLEHELKSGNYTDFSKHVSNMAAELEKLSQLPKTTGHESLRLIIPRALILIYTLRNKRGIGHVGGDVEANEIDVSTIVKLADWIICELIRLYHSLSLEEAQALVDAINIKSVPEIWHINGRKRVLKQNLDFKEQVLLLTYSEIDNGVSIEDLFAWTEYSSLSMFKKAVLMPLHEKKLIEYDRELNFVHISPLGIKQVEQTVLVK
jgi:hypothetical protein